MGPRALGAGKDWGTMPGGAWENRSIIRAIYHQEPWRRAGDAVFNLQRSNCEGVNGHVKVHYGLDTRLHFVGTGAITRHVLWTLIAVHVVAMVRLQHGVIGNLLSTSHIL